MNKYIEIINLIIKGITSSGFKLIFGKYIGAFYLVKRQSKVLDNEVECKNYNNMSKFFRRIK